MHKFLYHLVKYVVVITALADASGLNAQEPRYAEPIAVWDAFLAALRAGRMREAYACMAPRAREKQNYRDFCVAWHPLTKNTAAVLEPPAFSEFCIAGEIAFLRLGVRERNGHGDFRYAYLVREDGAWWLVALDPKIASPIIAEADGRNFLRVLWKNSPLLHASMRNGDSVDLRELQREQPQLFAQESTRRVLANYELEIDNLRDGVVRLRPRNDEVRCYEIGMNAEIALRNPVPARSLTTDEIARREQTRQKELAALAAKAAAQKAEADSARRKKAAAVPVARATAFRPAAKRVTAKIIRLPEMPPEFGNPDDIVPGAKVQPLATAQASKNPSPVSAKKEEMVMPEFDEPELLMSPPGGMSNLPPTQVKLSGK